MLTRIETWIGGGYCMNREERVDVPSVPIPPSCVGHKALSWDCDLTCEWVGMGIQGSEHEGVKGIQSILAEEVRVIHTAQRGLLKPNIIVAVSGWFVANKGGRG